MPVAALLTGEVEDPKQFQQAPQQVNDFIKQLNLTDRQLNNILKSLGLGTGLAASAATAALAQAVARDQVVVVARPPAKLIKPPPPNIEPVTEGLTLSEMINRPIPLGPHETSRGIAAAAAAAAIIAQKSEAAEKPRCQRNSLTVSCEHGHRVTLGPDTKAMPSLDIIASTKANKKPDRITITSDITEICPSHKLGHVRIGGEAVTVWHTQTGKTTTFKAYAEPLNIQRNPVKYAWLPNIKPETYPIYPGTTCDGSKLNDAAKGILLNVYPQVAWDWSVDVGYGTDEVVIESSENDKSAYQTALKRKRFSIDGTVKLIQDGETTELNSQFKQAVESTRQQINRVTDLVEQVISTFDEGDKPSVKITWPNLKLNLKTALAEGKNHQRVVDFDFGISAAPFFGIDCSVDIFPILIGPLAGGLVGQKLLKEVLASLEKGVGNEESIASLKGTVSVIMSGKGTLNCDAHFQGDFSENNNRIEKVSGKAIETKIEFSAEGKVDIRGHLLVIKVELVAGIGIKSGITLDLQIDSDGKGYYWQPNVKFNGVKVYITKYVKVKRDSGGGDDVSSRGAGTGSQQTIKEVKEHIWIDESKLETQKHYFIEY
ncbi:MAG: hypothetical protein L3J89_12705 [Gammaproteobacteria bacterium]|nr:hypothetical protein [Gammaproteobacteria bacterium]